MGFFTESLVNRNPVSSIPKCGACGLVRGCLSPKMAPSGRGKRGVLVVSEAPGKSEDEQGMHLIGKSGELLQDCFEEFGYDFHNDCLCTSAILCRPPEKRLPGSKEIDACRPNLLSLVKERRPHMVILLGLKSVEAFVGSIWGSSIGTLDRWVGWKIPCREYNTWICPNYHPSFVLRQNNPVLKLWFKRYLEQALDLQRRPYDGDIPDLQKNIRCVNEHEQAARLIRKFISSGKPTAFDFETDRLKPDNVGSRIVSCAISDGKRTLAYPWVGEAISATSDYLKSDVPKYGANIKFEQRWSRSILGHGVRNWKWDCMLASHVLRNTPGITSVKFQSFVRFGVGDYASHVKPYLMAKTANEKNRIEQLNLGKLLVYNGMDALLEYMVAKQQMMEMKCE